MTRSRIIWYINNFITSAQFPCGGKLAINIKPSFLKTFKATNGQSFIITTIWEDNLKGSFL